jgi:hypothetical protein
MNLSNVRWAVKDMRVEYPVAVGNEHVIWRAFRNQYWPALYRQSIPLNRPSNSPSLALKKHSKIEAGYPEPFVRDEGVTGSNPAIPTNPSQPLHENVWPWRMKCAGCCCVVYRGAAIARAAQ